MKVVLKNVTKKFPNRNRKIYDDFVAVDNFDFEIPDGKLIGLLGRRAVENPQLSI